MEILLGISLTLNILVALGIYLYFKFKSKLKNKFLDPIDMNGFINDDYNFLDKM